MFPLLSQIEAATQKGDCTSVSVSLFDYETNLALSHNGDRFYHAASTIKLFVLLALFKAAEEGRLRLPDPLHVRNRFRSIVDGSPFRLEINRDADGDVHRRVGRTMTMLELARAMIVTSSNLATNVLIEFLGIEYVQQVIERCGLAGVKFRRGVEDHLAFDRGINNEVTAHGLVQFYRLLREGPALTDKSREAIIEILLGQEFKSMIPAGLPAGVKVAHKTGEISTACHDAGLVFLPDREPYALAVLTESAHTHQERRARTVAAISSAVHALVTGHGEKAK